MDQHAGYVLPRDSCGFIWAVWAFLFLFTAGALLDRASRKPNVRVRIPGGGAKSSWRGGLPWGFFPSVSTSAGSLSAWQWGRNPTAGPGKANYLWPTRGTWRKPGRASRRNPGSAASGADRSKRRTRLPLENRDRQPFGVLISVRPVKRQGSAGLAIGRAGRRDPRKRKPGTGADPPRCLFQH